MNTIILEGAAVRMSLTQGKSVFFDLADLPIVVCYRWCATKDRKRWYAETSVLDDAGKRRTTKMHRIIMGGSLTVGVDHIDGDGLNNRRGNLRFATTSQNLQNRTPQANNTSGLKGVSRRPRRQGWEARIQIDGKSHYLGVFKCKFEAGRAYDRAAERLHGEFALTNDKMGLLAQGGEINDHTQQAEN